MCRFRYVEIDVFQINAGVMRTTGTWFKGWYIAVQDGRGGVTLTGSGGVLRDPKGSDMSGRKSCEGKLS